MASQQHNHGDPPRDAEGRSGTLQSGSAALFVPGALVLGVGLGGLVDGIVLHQVLQWHNLVSSRVSTGTIAGMATNLFWDGMFHLATTVLAGVGAVMVWRGYESQRHVTGNGAALAGLVLIGWGVFHAVDQLVFHELLGLHDIREDVAEPWLWNWGFFAVGLVLIGAGWALWRTRGLRRPP